MELPEAPCAPLELAVRPAGDRDLPEIDDLEAEGRAALMSQRGGDLLVGDLDRRRSAAELPGHAAVLLATVGGEPAGVARVRRSAGSPVAELAVLWVTPWARGVGVGHALLDEVGRTALQWGCDGLDATALPGDRSTKNFFEDHGMVARAIVAHGSLRAP